MSHFYIFSEQQKQRNEHLFWMKTRKTSPFLEMEISENFGKHDLFSQGKYQYTWYFRLLKMLLQDEIIFFSRVSQLKKIKMAFFLHEN